MKDEIKGFARPEKQNEDTNESEISLRPKYLREFIGQKSIRENLATFIASSLKRKECLDHLFLMGPPGLGKTTIAEIIAREMGSEIKITSAVVLEKPKDLVGILSGISEGTVFFIDEIHRLRRTLEEMLYIAMEDYELDWVIGQGTAARTIRIPIPRFTLVGATTKPGLLSSPLRSRFGIIERFEYYPVEDLSLIITRSSELLGVKVTKGAALKMAKSARGTPRVANRILRRMRDFACVAGKNEISEEIVREGLEKLKIDSLGLEKLDRDILLSLITNFSGGPVGVGTLAISVGEGIDTLEDYYEPYLIQCGLLSRTPKGRVATEKAYKHLRMKISGESLPSLFDSEVQDEKM